MKPVRLSVIGTGLIGSKHAALIASNSTCSLVGICDVDSSRRSVAEELNVPFYQDIEELLERERPQGAIISTPNGHHAAVAEVCARRSVHVLIEKPIADSLSEARRIIQVADDSGIQVLVGHHRRYNPLIQETRSVVTGGALGKLVAVSVLWVTRPGILVPAKVRENLMEEDKTDANAEVQTGTDRNGAETDRGGHGEWEVDAAGLQGGWDSYSDVLSVAEGVWRSEGGAGQTAEGVGEGKHPVETTGSRAVAGEAGVKGCSGGKLLSPERRRCAVERAEMRYGMSERHACRLLGQSRGTQRYEPMRRADEDRLTAAVVALASEYGRYGYKKIAAMLQRSGWQAGRDRVERIWRREGLKVPQKQRPRRRLWLNDGSCIRLRPERANHVWSYDFVNARTHDGRLLRILALIDEYTRECLALRVARRLNSQDVIETLSEVMLWRGIPEHIRSDNGPEFVARQLRDWLQGLGTSPLYIEPGSPWENGYCESFNGKLREECLNGEIFYSLKEARIVIEQWRQQYNRVRPHAALGYRPPAPGAYTPPWNPVPRPQVIM